MVTCASGFVPRNTVLHCQANGTWSSIARCVGRDCELLGPPENGNVTFTNNRQYPSNATFNCNEGFELESTLSVVRQCNPEDGTFAGPVPVCVNAVPQSYCPAVVTQRSNWPRTQKVFVPNETFIENDNSRQ